MSDGIRPVIGFTQRDYEVSEGSGGVMATIESSTVIGASLQVRVFTSDITALGNSIMPFITSVTTLLHSYTASRDYTAGDTTVVLIAGSSSWSVPITITDDDFIEPNERFAVTIETSNTCVELGLKRAEVVIRTDDGKGSSAKMQALFQVAMIIQ